MIWQLYMLPILLHSTFKLKIMIERVNLVKHFTFLDVQLTKNTRTLRAIGHFPPKNEKTPSFYFIMFDDGGTKEGRC